MALSGALNLLLGSAVTLSFSCVVVQALAVDNLVEKEEACNKAVQAWRTAPGDNQAFIAFELEKLALFCAQKNLLDQAIFNYREALKERQKSSTVESSFVALTQRKLAQCLEQRGDYAEAETLLRSALKIQTDLLGPDNREIEPSKVCLANCLRSAQKYDEAEIVYQDLLTLARQRSRSFIHQIPVLDDLTFAAELSQVIDIKMRAKKWKEAIPLAEELLALYQIRPEVPKDPMFKPYSKFDTKSLASAQLTMAICYANDQQPTRAEQLFQQALKIYQQTKDCPAAYIAILKSAQADNFVLQGRDKEAEISYKQALQIWKTVHEPNDFDEFKTIEGYLALHKKINGNADSSVAIRELEQRLAQRRPGATTRFPLKGISEYTGTIEIGG